MDNVREVLSCWDLREIRGVERINSYTGRAFKVTADAGDFVLKSKTSEDDAMKEERLLSFLDERSFPVALPVQTTTNRCYVSHQDMYYFLCRYVPGDICVDHYSGDAAGRARMFGEAISALHAELSHFPDTGTFQQMKLVHDLDTWISDAIEKHSRHFDAGFLKNVIGLLRNELGGASACLPVQMIHRDMHPGNMIFKDGKLKAVLDLEMALSGPRIFDLCYCASSILAGGFAVPGNREAWPGILHAMVDGYASKLVLTKDERACLWHVLLDIQLIFLAFCAETALPAAQFNERVLRWLFEQRDSIR